jgi:hypothetical protein
VHQQAARSKASAGWYILALLAVAVSGYALSQALLPGLRGDFVESLARTSPLASILHFVGGAIVLASGALQFHRGLRNARPVLHRWTGRIYIVGALVGGLAGLALAFRSFGGLVTHFGFGMMAVLWLFTTATAYRHIRAGNVARHQVWMIRSYALTLAAVTLRFYLPLSVISGLDFEASYQAIAWLCWVPNLIIAEWVFIARRG